MLDFFKGLFENFFLETGRYATLLANAFKSITEFSTYRENLFSQMVKIGIDSIPIIALTAIFSGAVTTVQTAYQLISPFIPKSVIGGVVMPSVILELGAILPGLVLAGRVGARISAELGTMQVSEQVDAIEAMGLNSIAFLVVPRVIAGSLMYPMLYIIACILGIWGGMIAGEISTGLPQGEFLKGARDFFDPFYVTFGMTKAFVFGFLTTSISCMKGYYTSGGAEGVGNSTTQAAVTSCVAILISDYLLAELLLT